MAGFDNLKGTTSDSFFIGKFSNKVYLRSNSGTIEAKNSTSPYFPLSRGSFTAKYTILTDFAAGEVLDLATGSGSISGTCTVTGQPANLSLPANATLFNESAEIQIYINGVLAERGIDVVWVSQTSISLTLAFVAGEVIEVFSPPF